MNKTYFLIPNLISYSRIILGLLCLNYYQTNVINFITIYLMAGLTDLLDGIAARKLNQTSKFGEIIDIVADNVQRSIMWIIVFLTNQNIYFKCMSLIIIITEWTTFLSLQINKNKKNWKLNQRISNNFLARNYFHNNFKNPIGALGISSLFFLPLIIYLTTINFINIPFIFYLLLIGRIISFYIEIFLIFS